MSELMRQIPFDKMIKWALDELTNQGSILGIRKEKFYVNKSGRKIEIFGDKISSPLGPAAGPNSQLCQNILAAFLTGSRFIELKTVQTMDGEELRNCVARPCINATDECYNVEWSTELYVNEAFCEYVKGWFLCHVIGIETGLIKERDFAFNMSVGYSLEGIQSEKIDTYIEGMKDASNTDIWKECYSFLEKNISMFKNFKLSDLEKISKAVAPSITLSTLHGCPKEEIEKIAHYLLTVKGIHTYIKCNPTLLGYSDARKILDDMGYNYISFDDHHFKNDLQFDDAVLMLGRLKETAKEKGLSFGVKITNTFPVQIKRKELPGEEMYMSGRALFPLSINVARKLTNAFNGELAISYSGGADYFNIEEIVKTGIRPITVATTILKPGGYERTKQLAELSESAIDENAKTINVKLLNDLADSITNKKHYKKSFRIEDNKKTDEKLPLFDCAKSPCSEGGCAINQQIPTYLKLVANENYDEAFKVIAIDNTAPSITGKICDHKCQFKCNRVDYEGSLEIRNAKFIASTNSQANFTESIKACDLKTDKKVAVIGAGPAGVAASLFLRRNGVSVTVFEKNEKPYGIVSYVIPEFRIAKDLIERDYQMAVKHGVDFKFSVSEDYCVEELKKDYDFVILATGAWLKGNYGLKTGNENLLDALEFLKKSKDNDCNIEVGENIAVIGGGDVAMDCARAAKRAKGAKNVSIVYRRTKEFMPAEHEEITLAMEDGVNVMELLAPVSYENGFLKCEVMELSDYDASLRRSIKGTGEFKEAKFDCVIGAVGARVDTSLFGKNKISLNERSMPSLNENNETNIENVYISGDCKKGPSTIVRAIADSKKIAIDILAKLNIGNDFVKYEAECDKEVCYNKKGVIVPAREDSYDGFRCLECDEVCELCCDVCPNRANTLIMLNSSKLKDSHQILHIDGMCNECGNCGVFCPYSGNPYKDKITVFWTEHDFIDSTNKGFLKVGENSYKVRTESGEIVLYNGGNNISDEMKEVIATVEKDYSRYIMS